MPLFEAGVVQAVFAGHDHFYERSERNGVTCLTSAGGGAPLYDRAGENPYSRRWRREHHGCLVEATPESLTIRALAAETGEIIDECVLERGRRRTY